MKISKTFKAVGANKDEAFENLLFDIHEFIRRENSDECKIEAEKCDECNEDVFAGSGRYINRVAHFDGGFTCAECDEKLRQAGK